MRFSRICWFIGPWLTLSLLPACSDSDEGTDPDSSSGGWPSSGGTGVGGTDLDGSGGVSLGGIGPGSGGFGAGGASTGGDIATGGLGPMMGGTGGLVATGGAVSTGGVATGGSTPTGGVATGGFAPTGGVGTGGTTDVPPVAYCELTQDWDPAWAALEQDILDIVNQVRSEGADCGGQYYPPTGPLSMDPALQCAARMHSLDMATRNFFDHVNPDGDGPSERMAAAGYDGWDWGENIAGGRSDAAGTMDQWMNSPGHCSNIMSDNYTLIGVGYYPGGQYGTLWTQTFGS